MHREAQVAVGVELLDPAREGGHLRGAVGQVAEHGKVVALILRVALTRGGLGGLGGLDGERAEQGGGGEGGDGAAHGGSPSQV